MHLEPLRKVVDTPEAVRLMAEYDELAEAIENAKAKQDDVRAKIIDLAGGRSATIAGRNVTKVEAAGRVAYAKAIAELLPKADLSKWRGKPSTSWRIG